MSGPMSVTAASVPPFLIAVPEGPSISYQRIIFQFKEKIDEILSARKNFPNLLDLQNRELVLLRESYQAEIRIRSCFMRFLDENLSTEEFTEQVIQMNNLKSILLNFETLVSNLPER